MYRTATGIPASTLAFIARLAALVPKPRANLTRYHGVLAPNHRWRGLVTPTKRGKSVKRISDTEVRSPAERHVAMTWAQRLKRVFNIDIEECSPCVNLSESLRALRTSTSLIEFWLTCAGRNRTHLPYRCWCHPSGPRLSPCLCSAERISRLHSSISMDAIKKNLLAGSAAGCSSRINEYDLQDHRCGYRFGTIGKLFAKVQESTTKPD